MVSRSLFGSGCAGLGSGCSSVNEMTGTAPLAEQSQHPCDEKNDQDSAEPDARATARTPAAVAVIASATAKQQNEKNYDYQHDDYLAAFLSFLPCSII